MKIDKQQLEAALRAELDKGEDGFVASCAEESLTEVVAVYAVMDRRATALVVYDTLLGLGYLNDLPAEAWNRIVYRLLRAQFPAEEKTSCLI